MSEDLIQTKISIPPLRMQLVHRERLYRRLDAGARCRLTLVAAPAGFGKSTLLGSWAERQEIPLGWYSLDEQDNDPDRFLAYLLAALQSVAPQLELREGTAALRQTRQGAVDQALLTFLANRVKEYAQPLGIVLDDYHVIANPAVDEILSFLLEHMPLPFHLIVSSRQEPAFPVARLRAAGQVQAISEQDLRFTSEEAAQFLEQGMGLQIQPEDIAALEARTEGWIAGLQLAALSLEGRPDPAAFIASLRGTDRYILDYLAEEVFARLPGPLQIFLLRLSIVDRFGEGLCDALAADGPDAEWSLGTDGRETLSGHRSRAVLEFLDSSNLFVVPLDHERRWYRFHQLFADFLRDRLQAFHPDWIPDLRRRAAEWYASEGLAADAIHQALLAQEPRLAASLIEGQVRTMLTHGQTGTLTRWIESLPDDTLSARPELLLALAWSQLLGDVVRNQASIVRIAFRLSQCLGTSRETVALRLGEQSLAAGERGTLGQYALLMAFLGRDSVPLEETVSLFHAALEAIPPDDLFARGMGLGGLGSTYARQGRLSLAERTFADSAETTRRHESPYAYLVAKDWEATVQSAQGLLTRAGSTYRGVIERLREMSAERLPLTGHAFVGLADILREQNDLQAALEHVTEGLHRGQLIMDHDALREGYLIQARILAAVGDEIGAHRALEAGLEEARMIGSQACLQEAEAWEAMLNLAWGDTAAAMRWASRRDLLGLLDQERTDLLEPIERRALARLLAVQGRHAQAASVLVDVVRTADAGEQARLALEARCALSVLLHAVGDRDGAMRTLAKALLFGEPEAYLRSFVDEGPRMAALLHRAAAEGHSPAYAQRILAAFGHERPAESLVEPLTERELEVLRLLAEGLTNAQIAAKLVVAQSTVKTHIHHLYGRLGVTGRTQAAARARELRLLE